MKKWNSSGFRGSSASAFLFTLALLLPPNPGHAGAIFDPPDLDHLKCYRIKDSLEPQWYAADLANQFGIEQNCRIRVPARLLCAETNKRVRRPQPPGGGPAGDPAGHFLCYALRCANDSDIPDFGIEDQFGRRVISVERGRLLCAPADKFICGDGDLDPGEQCDPGSATTAFCADGTPCGADCRCPSEPVCCECDDGQCFEDVVCPAVCTPVPGTNCSSRGICEECECGTTCVTSSGLAGDCRPTGSAITDPCECVPSIPDCPCGDICTTTAGIVGECRPTAGSTDCSCVPDQPDCPCGASCIIGTSPGVCVGTAANPNDCSCRPVTQGCPCGTLCVTPDGNPGACRPIPGNPNICECLRIPDDCPCGTDCTNAAGEVGICRQLDPNSSDCSCFIPPPPPDCPCGTTCTNAAGEVGICRQLDPNSSDCSCFIPPPPPDCPCGTTCTNAAGEVGICRQLDPNSSDCSCFIPPPPPDCPCGTTCTNAAGEVGICRQLDPNSSDCSCFIPPPPPDCPCGTTCTENGVIGRCRPDTNNPSAGCVCRTR